MGGSILTDTCPVCNATVEFAMDGVYRRCTACRRGFVRWVPDDPTTNSAPTVTDAAIALLRVDLAEAEEWLAEDIPGAAKLVALIRANLERLARETG